jgi:hypothetical protein
MDERRRAFRMRALPDFDQVVLKVRGRQVSARLYDTSLSGLGVIFGPGVTVQIGDILMVSSDGGWFSAKVARVATTPEGQLVGLERCTESPEATQARKDESRLIAVVFTIAIIAMPLVTLVWTHSQPLRPRVANSSQPVQLDNPSPSEPTSDDGGHVPARP